MIPAKYPKIPTIWKRDTKGKIIEGEYSTSEIEFLKDNIWIFEEKIDGTNIRIYWDAHNKNIEFGGKTDKAQIPDFLLEKLKKLFTIDKFELIFPETSIILFGEGYGNRIQKIGKKYISDGVSFILFDAKIGNYWLYKEDMIDIANKLKIKVIPTLGFGTLDMACDKVKEGFRSLVAEEALLAEGLVLKPKIQMFDRMGHRIMAKIKHKDYQKIKEV